MTESQIKENLQNVLAQIADAEQKAGRGAGEVKLCAVSKFHPLEAVLAAEAAGQTLFGENRVQEAYAKFTALHESGKSAELHIIGSLQLNKVKKAVEIASCIQSVDREDLLAEIEKHCAKLNKNMRIFFEIHTGEESKSGYSDEVLLEKSLKNCAEGVYPHIIPAGLMTMAPFTQAEALIRRSFASLRNLREKIKREYPSLAIQELSMGMSGDFKIAIEEGSTMVRVGTAIFGSRPAAV